MARGEARHRPLYRRGLDGHLTTHTYLAPYIPAEYIENIREYDTKALEAALTGGGE